MNWFTTRKKRNLGDRLEFLKAEGISIREAIKDVAVTSEIEYIDMQEVAEIIKAISPSGFKYRVTLDGATGIYNSINERNYIKLVNGIGHLEEEDEFLAGMCLIDKCEEYGDFERMAQVFRIFEYVVRHKKADKVTPIIGFARQYTIEMRTYLSELGLL